MKYSIFFVAFAVCQSVSAMEKPETTSKVPSKQSSMEKLKLDEKQLKKDPDQDVFSPRPSPRVTGSSASTFSPRFAGSNTLSKSIDKLPSVNQPLVPVPGKKKS